MNPLAFFIVFLATIAGALGALFLKRGSANFSLQFGKLVRNHHFFFGGFLYVLSLPLYLYALKNLPLNIAYPLTSMTYIWVALLSKYYLKEEIDGWRLTGIIFIILGIVLLGV